MLVIIDDGTVCGFNKYEYIGRTITHCTIVSEWSGTMVRVVNETTIINVTNLINTY